MKSTKQLNKRSISPLVPKTIQVSERKKKSTSNYPSNPYKNALKQFQTYGKTQKKKHGNYLKDLLKNNDSGNKYRIVTEPVDDKVMHLISSSFGRISRSKNKPDALEVEHVLPNFKVRNSSHSNQKLKTKPADEHQCKNCKKYQQELTTFKEQLNKLLMSKMLWQGGQMTLSDLKKQFKIDASTGGSRGSVGQTSQYKSVESIIHQTKKHLYDLMKDIESLTQIDYPKMLNLNLFHHEPIYSQFPEPPQTELKSLLGQLRNSVEGKLSPWDLQDETEDSEHVKAMLRNLKARCNHYLRQNLQLRTKKAVLQRAEEISAESEEYLRRVVESVLISYSKT